MTQGGTDKPSAERVTDANLLEFKYGYFTLDDIREHIDRTLRRERERVIEECAKTCEALAEESSCMECNGERHCATAIRAMREPQ